jgi:plastocyanin
MRSKREGFAMASTVAANTGVAVGHPKSKWTRVAVLGFALIAAGMLLWIVGGLVAGQELGEASFFAIAIVASLIAAGVVWRFGTVGKAIGIFLGLATMVAFFWVAFSLGMPSAFVEFSGAVMFIVGAFTGVGYSIAGIVRRNELHTDATRGETRAMRIMLGIVALAMIVSAVLNVTSRGSVSDAAAADATTITQSSFAFEPLEYTATAGTATKFLVHNGDAFAHDFAIEGLDINSGIIPPGGEKLVEVNAPAGEYLIRCTLHSDSDTEPANAGKDGDMSARLTVE